MELSNGSSLTYNGYMPDQAQSNTNKYNKQRLSLFNRYIVEGAFSPREQDILNSKSYCKDSK
jgi:hypothetical protein